MNKLKNVNQKVKKNVIFEKCRKNFSIYCPCRWILSPSVVVVVVVAEVIVVALAVRLLLVSNRISISQVGGNTKLFPTSCSHLRPPSDGVHQSNSIPESGDTPVALAACAKKSE